MSELPIGPFRDGHGRYRTLSLFTEHNQSSLPAVFTVKPYNQELHGATYPSLKLLYLELATAPVDGEYEFAMAVFNSWEQWQRLLQNALIGRLIEEWRNELEIKIRSAAIKSLAKTAIEEGSKGTAAAKWLASGQWKAGKGRPTKAEIDARKKLEAGIIDELDEDAERLGLH